MILSIMEDQDELIMRKSDCEEVGLEASNLAALEDSVFQNKRASFYQNKRSISFLSIILFYY